MFLQKYAEVPTSNLVPAAAAAEGWRAVGLGGGGVDLLTDCISDDFAICKYKYKHYLHFLLLWKIIRQEPYTLSMHW